MNTNFEGMSLDELLDVMESEEYGSISKMLARQFVHKHFDAAQHRLAGGFAVCDLPGCLKDVYKSGLCVDHYEPQTAKA